MIRKITNKGITMVNIFIILVRLLYQQINNVDNVALLHELIVHVNEIKSALFRHHISQKDESGVSII